VIGESPDNTDLIAQLQAEHPKDEINDRIDVISGFVEDIEKLEISD
jgi:hypothetical protein